MCLPTASPWRATRHPATGSRLCRKRHHVSDSMRKRSTLKCLSSRVSSLLAPTMLALLAVVGTVHPGSAQDGVKPLAPGEKAFSLTLGEWAAAYVQWQASLPSAVQPQGDNTRSLA